MDEALIQSVAKAIEAADVGYNIRLTKLLDGISEYTLTYSDGEERVFEDTGDAYRHTLERLSRARAVAAIGAVDQAILDERERCAAIAEGWLTVFGDADPKFISAKQFAGDAVRDIADAIRNRHERSSSHQIS